jgi:pimeloyl-ACP methyl ester carboxylesterase
MEHRNAYLAPLAGEPSLRIHYLDCKPSPSLVDPSLPRGTLLLIHGFPQTSYQFRKVMLPLAELGYRVIAPDYRGAGESSHPRLGYDKVTMARDLHRLLTEHLLVHDKVHVIGHDIGGMIAYAFATQYPHSTASVIWGECPLPGSSFYDECKNGVDKFHFTFHCVPDGLREALVAGRERIYLKQFFDRQIVRSDGISEADFDHYVRLYSLPDGMRSAFEVYRAFEADKIRNIAHRGDQGVSTIPSMILSGELSDHAAGALDMAHEFMSNVVSRHVEGAAHYIAEENPAAFVEAVSSFLASLRT